MKKIKKLLNLLIKSTEKFYKIIQLKNVSMYYYVIFLLNMWMKKRNESFFKT